MKNHQGCRDNPSDERRLTIRHQPVKYSHTIAITQDIALINLVNQTGVF